MRWSKMEGGRLFRTLGTATEAKSEQLLDSLLHCNWLLPNIVHIYQCIAMFFNCKKQIPRFVTFESVVLNQ